MRTIFGLMAKGDSINGWPFRMACKRLFWTREAAEAHIPKFADSCCDEKHFERATKENLRVTVAEYEIEDNNELTA